MSARCWRRCGRDRSRTMERLTPIGRRAAKLRSAAKPARKPRATRNRLSSVATAIRLLKAFSEDEQELGVSALAAKLGVAKSTVHRLAVTLVSEGLLEQDIENGR